ncbi:MAG: DUF1800 family protein, partial [Terriglobia bacterium]
MTNRLRRCWRTPLRAGLAVWLAALLLSPGYAFPQARSLGPPDKASQVKLPESVLTGDEKIVHLLNRIGFGPRPSEVERVKQMGLAAYLEQQLHPETISDKKLEARLAGFDTLHMDRFELFASYPPPPLLRAIADRLGPQAGIDQASMDLMFPE